MRRSVQFSLAAIVVLAAGAAFAVALDPGLAGAVISFITSPTVAGGALLAATVPVDVEFLKAELGKLGAAMRERGDETDTRQAGLNARLTEIEQRAARPRGSDIGGHGYAGPGVAQLLWDEAGFQALRNGTVKEFRFALPPGTFHAAAVTNDGLPTTAPAPGLLIPPGQRRATIRDLLSAIPVTSNAVEYARETTFTNNAEVVTEGAVKPETVLDFDLESAQVATIAHWVHASRQALDDLPMLQNYIDVRLRYGLMLKEEQQLLLGSGVGANLKGMYVFGTAYSAPASVTAEQRIDRLRLAIAQLAAANYVPTGIVLNPIDWALIEMTKAATTNEYILPNAPNATAPNLWGIPVIPTNAQTADTFTVGDFMSAAVLLDREAVRIDIATQDQDDFVRNMVKIRVEERIGLALRLPQAIIKGADLSP